MMSASFLGTWGNQIRTPAAQNPTIIAYNSYGTYDSNFKVFGTYNARWGIVIRRLSATSWDLSKAVQ